MLAMRRRLLALAQAGQRLPAGVRRELALTDEVVGRYAGSRPPADQVSLPPPPARSAMRELRAPVSRLARSVESPLLR